MVSPLRKTYSELKHLHTFEDRFNYLRLFGEVGGSTFGHDRHINQSFYASREWADARDFVIVRDDGCDLGIPDRPIGSELLVHHINPMRADDIVHGESWIIDPEYLITTCQTTHNAIHFGGVMPTIPTLVERRPGDTKLW